jgi:hypothetical protein
VPQLSEFEGLAVTEVGVEMPNAAGGLQEAMQFDPVEWHKGEEHFIVLRCKVKKIRFDPIDKDDFDGPQRRVHILHVDQAAPIEAEHVQAELTAYQERIKKAKDEAEGTPALPLEDDSNLPVGDDEV